MYCDATIACSGRYFPVHRFVLTTCSEYFEGIFERTHCKHPFVIIKDIEEFHLEALLNYMYNGEVNVLQDRLPGLIRAAEALRIRGLAICEDSSGDSSTPEGKKSHKEKKKSDNSSPSVPKSKKIGDKSSVVKKLDLNSNGNVGNNNDTDEIAELSNSDREKQPSQTSPRNDSRDEVEEFILTEGQSQRNETNTSMDVDDKVSTDYLMFFNSFFLLRFGLKKLTLVFSCYQDCLIKFKIYSSDICYFFFHSENTPTSAELET